MSKSKFFELSELENIEDIRNDIINNWKEEWKEMPEYISKNLEPYKTVYVHFRCEEDYKNFGKVFNYNITEKTNSLWFPKLEHQELGNIEYIDKSELTNDMEILDITDFDYRNKKL